MLGRDAMFKSVR